MRVNLQFLLQPFMLIVYYEVQNLISKVNTSVNGILCVIFNSVLIRFVPVIFYFWIIFKWITRLCNCHLGYCYSPRVLYPMLLTNCLIIIVFLEKKFVDYVQNLLRIVHKNCQVILQISINSYHHFMLQVTITYYISGQLCQWVFRGFITFFTIGTRKDKNFLNDKVVYCYFLRFKLNVF